MPQFPRACTEAEFACHSYNECVALEYRCDRRPDCRDMSDELNCGEGMSEATSGLGARGGPGCYTWVLEPIEDYEGLVQAEDRGIGRVMTELGRGWQRVVLGSTGWAWGGLGTRSR